MFFFFSFRQNIFHFPGPGIISFCIFFSLYLDKIYKYNKDDHVDQMTRYKPHDITKSHRFQTKLTILNYRSTGHYTRLHWKWYTGSHRIRWDITYIEFKIITLNHINHIESMLHVRKVEELWYNIWIT